MKFKTFALVTVAAAMAMLPAAAHHSYAMFDATKTVMLEGTVKRFHWTNPHSWIYLTVNDASGAPVEWAIEHGSPSGLARAGWTPKTLTPGMKIKLTAHPLKDGGNGGQFLQVTLPDGKQMGDPEARRAGTDATQD